MAAKFYGLGSSASKGVDLPVGQKINLRLLFTFFAKY